jgi:hypothetical protein
MTLSTPKISDAVLIVRMRKLGMQMPVRTLRAARYAGLSLPVACSILTQETGGGRNEWGHDPTIFIGGYDAKNKKNWGETVTKAAYTEYKKQSGYTGSGGMQGVGPCQLTYYGYQNAADKIGGCWNPLPNMKIGFTTLAASIRRNGLHDAIRAYNGVGPAAERYATTVIARAEAYSKVLGVPV